MFAKNKVTQSMLDAVNSVLEESNIDEASLKIPTTTGTKVLGRGYGNSAKAHEVQHKNPFEKGPSKKDLKGIKAPTKKELKTIGESEGSEEDKEQDAKAEKATGMTHAQYEKSARDKKEDKKKNMKKESAFTSKLLSVFRENKASGAQETFTDNNMGENKALVGKQKKLDKNHNGKLDAQDFKMLRKEDISEEQLDEMINEVLSKDAPAGEWIHDFVHSKNPKFDGKSKAERKKMALGAYYGAQKEEVEQINEISKSEVEHHFNNWTNSEHAPDHHDSGDDKKIHRSALNYLKHTKEPKEKHEKIALHIADKFHGSGLGEEVELEEGDAQYKKTTPTKPMSDVVDRKKTVKDLMKGRKYFGSGKVTLPPNSKVKELDEIEEAVQTTQDKNAGKITTDTLVGRVAGGKLNSFRNFKTNLTTSGEDSIPSEIEHGEDTKEKEKVSTNPGPVDIKLDDKLTGPTPYTHFQKKEKVTSEEFRGEAKNLQHIRDTEQKHEIKKFKTKVVQAKEEFEPINEDGWLDKYLLSKGINPQFVSQATKISHAKSGAFMTWKQSHQTESVSVPFDKPYKTVSAVTTDKSGAKHTAMSRAKDLAKTALKKIKQDAGNEKG